MLKQAFLIELSGKINYDLPEFIRFPANTSAESLWYP